MANSSFAARRHKWQQMLQNPQGAGGATAAGNLEWALRLIGIVAGVAVVLGAVVSALSGSTVLAAALAGLLILGLVAVLLFLHRRLSATLVEPVGALAESVALMDQGIRIDPNVAGSVEATQVAGGLQRLTVKLQAGEDWARRQQEDLVAYDEDMQNLLVTSRLVSGNFNQAFLLRTIAIAAVEATGQPRARVWLNDHDRLVARYDSAAEDVLAPGLEPIGLGMGRVGTAALTRTVQVENPGAEDSTALTPASLGGETPGAAVPLEVGGVVLGVLEVVGTDGEVLSTQDRRMLEILAAHAATALEGARLEAKVEMLLRTDAATGLANYRQFVADLHLEMERSKRYARPLSLIVMDLDHFADFNTTHGRDAGDDMLGLVASVLTAEARACDTAYRLGGDEFMVVAREITGERAEIFAERLRNRLDAAIQAELPGTDLTVSLGVADMGGEPDGDILIEHSLSALEQAKAIGPGQVAAWVSPPVLAEAGEADTVSSDVDPLRVAAEAVGESVAYPLPGLAEALDALTASVAGAADADSPPDPLDATEIPEVGTPAADSVTPAGTGPRPRRRRKVA